MPTTVCRLEDLGPAELDRWSRLQRGDAALHSPFLRPAFAVAVGRRRPDARVAVVEDGGEVIAFSPSSGAGPASAARWPTTCPTTRAWCTRRGSTGTGRSCSRRARSGLALTTVVGWVWYGVAILGVPSLGTLLTDPYCKTLRGARRPDGGQSHVVQCTTRPVEISVSNRALITPPPPR